MKGAEGIAALAKGMERLTACVAALGGVAGEAGVFLRFPLGTETEAEAMRELMTRGTVEAAEVLTVTRELIVVMGEIRSKVEGRVELPVMGAPRKVPKEVMDRAVESVRRGEVSASEVARRLGVNHGTILYHLRGGKVGAVERVLARESRKAERLASGVVRAVQGAATRELKGEGVKRFRRAVEKVLKG